MHDSIVFNCISITVTQFQNILWPPKKPIPMSSPSPKLLETTNLPSVSMDLPFSSISYKCNSICGLLCLASCIYNVFKVDPCCFTYQSFISFYSWIIFCGVDTHVLFILSLVDVILGVYTIWLLWIMLLWTFMHKFLSGRMLSSPLCIYEGWNCCICQLYV